MSNAPMMKPRMGEVIIGMTTFGISPVCHFKIGPVVMGRGQGRSAQAANERVTGTRRQTQQPGDQVPDDRAEQRAEDRRHGNNPGIDHALADRRSDSGAHKRAGQIKESGQRDGLPRSKNFGGDDGRDGVGCIVKAIDVFEGDGREDDEDETESYASLVAV